MVLSCKPPGGKEELSELDIPDLSTKSFFFPPQMKHLNSQSFACVFQFGV